MSEKKANCVFCSLACPMVLKGGVREAVFTDDAILSVDWDKSEDNPYEGSLCARGNALAEFVSNPERLNYPLVIGERTGFEAAVKEAASSLKAVKEESGPESIGLIAGGNLTTEEAALAHKFAREVLGTENVGLLAPDDVPLFRGWTRCDLSGVSAAGGKPEGEKIVTFIIGDPFADHPCTAKGVLRNKYAGRGNEVIVVAPNRTNTAWFANRHIECAPGGEAAAAAGMLKAAVEKSGARLPEEVAGLVKGAEWNEIERAGGTSREILEEAAGSMLEAARVDTYVSNLFGRIGAPAVTVVAAEALTAVCPGDTTFTPQFVQQNTLGVYSAFSGTDGGKVLESLAEGKLKGLVLLGVDIFSEYPAPGVEKALREDTFTLATQLFRNTTAARANVVIPAASLIEKTGTVFPEFDRKIERKEEDIINPPGGVFTDGEFLEALSREMGQPLRLEPDSAQIKRAGSGNWLAAEWSAYIDSLKELDGADNVLISLSDPVHVGDGSMSRTFSWSYRNSPEPKLVIPEALAEELKLSEGDRAMVKTEGGSGLFKVKTSERIKKGTVGIYAHYPEARALFPWKLDRETGELALMPVSVEVSGEEKKS